MSAAADNSANEAAVHLERRLEVVTARIGVYTESCAYKGLRVSMGGVHEVFDREVK
jgi:hypothetical protein